MGKCFVAGDRTHPRGQHAKYGHRLPAQQSEVLLCDDRQLSNLDLVAEHEGISLQQAAEWIADRFSVPAAGKSKSASARATIGGARPIRNSRCGLGPTSKAWSWTRDGASYRHYPPKIFTILLVLLLVEVSWPTTNIRSRYPTKDLQELSGRGKTLCSAL